MADLHNVMKGLECCASCNGESCRKCPYQNESHGSAPMCTAHLAGDAFELLKSQRAENERLKKNIKMKNVRLKIMKADKEYWQIKWLATLEENDD